MSIRSGDATFVASDEIHQFRTDAGERVEFMCAVPDMELRPMIHREQQARNIANGSVPQRYRDSLVILRFHDGKSEQLGKGSRHFPRDLQCACGL